jgi:hypothetical protein
LFARSSKTFVLERVSLTDLDSAGLENAHYGIAYRILCKKVIFLLFFLVFLLYIFFLVYLFFLYGVFWGGGWLGRVCGVSTCANAGNYTTVFFILFLCMN